MTDGGDESRRDNRAEARYRRQPTGLFVLLRPLDELGVESCAEALVEGLKARKIEPHVAINGTVSKNGKVRKTAVPSKVAASLRYAISQRKRIEECFGWGKTVGGLAQLKVRGLDKVRAVFVFAVAAYNLVRLPKLLFDGPSVSNSVKRKRK